MPICANRNRNAAAANGAFMSKGFSGLDPEAAAAEGLADSIRALTYSIRTAIPGRR